MSEPEPLPRSPAMMTSDDTALLVVDVQTKLIGLIPGHERIVWNVGRLIEGAKILGLPVAATEQYPKGLGPTVDQLAAQLGTIPSKLTFSCGGCPEIFNQWHQQGITKVMVAGIEAHVCVQQTVLDLMADGFDVYVAVDALGSRHAIDFETALRRMETSGATLTTTEAALFEWCAVAGTPQFKRISQLVRQQPPGDS